MKKINKILEWFCMDVVLTITKEESLIDILLGGFYSSIAVGLCGGIYYFVVKVLPWSAWTRFELSMPFMIAGLFAGIAWAAYTIATIVKIGNVTLNDEIESEKEEA